MGTNIKMMIIFHCNRNKRRKCNDEYEVPQKTKQNKQTKTNKQNNEVPIMLTMIRIKMPAKTTIAALLQTRALLLNADTIYITASKCSPIKDCVHVKTLLPPRLDVSYLGTYF